MDLAAKNALLERISAYLEDYDAGVSGVSTEHEPDLFSFFTELAALKNEVKLESRQVKEALNGFRELLDRLGRVNLQLEAELARRRESEEQRLADRQKGLLLDLLELRDRLAAGCEQANRFQPGWVSRRSRTGKFLAGLAEGQSLSLARLDAILERNGVQLVNVLGERFDPLLMHAVDTDQDLAREEGLVIGQIRAGYLRGAELLRPAEVIVNKTR